MKINWKKTAIIFSDILIAVYLFFAVTSWNKPDESYRVCTKVEINIEDENECGFLKSNDIKLLLTIRNVYPLDKPLNTINTREIEKTLRETPFVKSADCHVTQAGHACITITQRTPLIRVKAINGSDYYIDDAGGVMPNTKYTSDMIIITGFVSKQYACRYMSIMATLIMADDFWKNQIEQINVLADNTVEIIPRVGNHIINIGQLPTAKDPERRNELVTEYVKSKLDQMEKFYQYGISQTGWEKYSYISLEFDKQIVCTKAETSKSN